MDKQELFVGAACIAGIALIIAHSVSFSPEMMSTPPWVLEKTYFENLGEYSGQAVYVFAVAESVSGNRISFINAMGELSGIEVESAEGVAAGTLMFMEVVYDSDSGRLFGKVLYLPIYGEERLEVSVLALAWVLIFYFVWKKKLRVEWKRLKVIVQGPEAKGGSADA